MKTNYVLIDYENVQPDLDERLASDVFRIVVFIGSTQSRVRLDVALALQSKGAAAQYIRISSSGKNALDFHIAYYLGQLTKADPEAFFHIISEDKGFDPLVEHLQSQGLKAYRHKTIDDIPIVKQAPKASKDDKLSAVIENLIRRGKQRPASLKTLRGSVAALFHPALSETETASLLADLMAQGVFAVQENRIHYALPDSL
jgi:hypothetical protein